MIPSDREWAERFFANVSWGLGALHLGLAILFLDADAALMVLVNLACLTASTHGWDACDWTELYKHADGVLYQVKKAGGRGCRFYHP